jgi:UDP-N-acetylglucosamine 2-epimerase
MEALKILTIVGARPQFVKAAAVSRAVAAHNEGEGRPLRERIVHTGQHYDANMSAIFFKQLRIPEPAANLEVGSGPHGRQTARMLERIEADMLADPPDWVLIYGDTNSTVAAALAAAKLHVPVAHVEAGLRSFNRRMPEEINRVVADHLSAMLLCPTETALANLSAEGVAAGVHQVGDVMYDSVLFNSKLAEQDSTALADQGLEPGSYCLATIHRAENTDDPARLDGIVRALERLEVPVVLPLHPRTRKTLGSAVDSPGGRVRAIAPVAYLDMLMLLKHARLVLTDSGGVQKEAYWMGRPCVTLRDETEWVELVEAGCNRLVGADTESILAAVTDFERAGCELPPGQKELYGDGRASERIVRLLAGG